MKKKLIVNELSVYDNIKRSAREYGSLCALDYFGRDISYRELIREINRCACALIACGVSRGDIITVCLPNVPQAVYLFYAASKLGACADMADPYMDCGNISERIEKSGSKYVFAIDSAAPELEERLAGSDIKLAVAVSVEYEMPFAVRTGRFFKEFGKKRLKSSFIGWKSFISGATPSDRFINVHGAGADMAAFLSEIAEYEQTEPLPLTNSDFNEYALYCLGICTDIGKADRVLAVVPISQGFGIGTCMHSVFALGGTAVILPNFNNDDIDRAILRYCPNVLAGDRKMFESLAESSGLDGQDIGFIKSAVLGGTPPDEAVRQKVNGMLKEHGCECEICDLMNIRDFVRKKADARL